ncbi:MAG: phosphoglycerate kinase [Candidatus Helarchaeota archaeon]|nr:phosphoglycerate kinase [Candidatus Helarchaeota archaeon]
MKYNIKTIDDFDVKGKKVLVRVDINSSINRKDNILMNTLRIEELKPTLDALKESAVVILAHQGRAGKKDFTSLQPHAEAMKKLYGDHIKFIDCNYGSCAVDAIKDLKPGEVLLLQNVRYMAEETMKGSPEDLAKTHFVQTLAPLFDLFVCDAWGAAHRGQTSLVGFTEVLPSCMGKIFEEELDVMAKITDNPQRPVYYAIGGAKVETKFKVLKNLLDSKKADKILVCGLLQNILLQGAGVEIGAINKKPIKNFEEYLPTAKEIMNKYKDYIVLPTDLALNINKERKDIPANELKNNPDYPSNDIGKKTAETYAKILKEAGTIVSNGPAGVFEIPPFDYGSKVILKAMAANEKAFTVVGGGEMGGLCQDLKLPVDFISTGGGAMLAFLTGKKLPVIEALKEASKRS